MIEAKDLDKLGMELTLRHFAADMGGADVALFYFSGHGAQVGDRITYCGSPLMWTLVGASLSMRSHCRMSSSLMRAAGAKIQLLVLDACRNNPFSAQFENDPGADRTAQTRSVSARGFAAVDAGSGALIAFSAAPGQVAQDGAGEVSPFTEAFLKYAGSPSLEVRQMLSRVRAFVSQKTDEQQVPWDNSSLLGDVFLVPRRQPPVFDRMARVEIADNAVERIGLRPPIQPEGGDVQVKIDRAPLEGRLLLDEREIGAEDTLAPADFAEPFLSSLGKRERRFVHLPRFRRLGQFGGWGRCHLYRRKPLGTSPPRRSPAYRR